MKDAVEIGDFVEGIVRMVNKHCRATSCGTCEEEYSVMGSLTNPECKARLANYFARGAASRVNFKGVVKYSEVTYSTKPRLRDVNKTNLPGLVAKDGSVHLFGDLVDLDKYPEFKNNCTGALSGTISLEEGDLVEVKETGALAFFKKFCPINGYTLTFASGKTLQLQGALPSIIRKVEIL